MYQDYTMPYYAESPPTLRSLFSEVLVTQFPSQYSRDTVPSDSVLYCTSRAKAFDCVRSTVRSLSIRSYRVVFISHTYYYYTNVYFALLCREPVFEDAPQVDEFKIRERTWIERDDRFLLDVSTKWRLCRAHLIYLINCLYSYIDAHGSKLVRSFDRVCLHFSA